MKNRKLLAGPYLFWSVSFIIIPLLMIFYYGLTDKEGTFTWSNIAMMALPENLKALGLALLLSLVSTLICLVLAYPLAMILSEKNMNQTSLIVLIFILPMWMNFLLRTLAWQTLLEKNGVINSILAFFHLPQQSIINTPGAIVLGMVYNFLPFMVLPIYNVLAKIDKDVIYAARDLGANEFQTFTQIIFPLSIPGIISGITMVFDLCYFRPSRWKQDSSDWKRDRAGIQTGKQLAYRFRFIPGADDLHHRKYGCDRQI